MEKRIRLTSSNSVTSVNEDNIISVDIEQTGKPYHFTDIKDTIDQYEVYEDERDNCDKYRLIVTINPFCTNILFNQLTEIIKDEGSDNPDVVTDTTKPKTSNTKSASGNTSPERYQMIQNTEYSKDSFGYEYHPGYDIFNNHLLRCKNFKIVNLLKSSSADKREVYNTLKDYMRTEDGNEVVFMKRAKLWDDPVSIKKHLYDYDDVLTLTESINNNLTEDNGWVGFVNSTNVDGVSDSKTREKLDIGKILNNHESCEFIDMYPDRTLYSFNPKYNSYKHRPEYNWGKFITYPYKQSYLNHSLIYDAISDLNAMKIFYIQKSEGSSDDYVYIFRTYCKHGLKQGDNICIYHRKKGSNSEYTKYSSYISVTNVGNLSNKYTLTHFYTRDAALEESMKSIYGTDFVWSDIDFRFTRVNGSTESEYYFRIFKKLPNFKKRRRELTEEIAKNSDEFEKYVNENACVGADENTKSKMFDFDRETYQLGFASTIFNDNSTQITFSDGLDISYIRDNRNRPLTELYLTVVKNNVGYEDWYNGIYKDSEYSHCFGKVTAGLDFHDFPSSDESDTRRESKGSMSDIRIINNYGMFGSNPLYNEGTDEITIEDDEFVGDLVEYNPTECKEIVLEDVYHRFNTAQRDLVNVNSRYEKFNMDEIEYDDYDVNDFSVNSSILSASYTTHMKRPEGYFYKAHYRIPVRENGSINQASHYNLKIRETKPILLDTLYVQVKTKLPHRLAADDIVYICTVNDMYPVKVAYVVDKLTFDIPIPMAIVNSGVNFVSFCDNLNNPNTEDTTQNFTLRRQNTSIPSYADRVADNTYLWREVRRVGNQDNQELENYPFVNGYFYINKVINFFLRRQDPDGRCGLYDTSENIYPNDPYGNMQEESNYNYKDTENVVC